jgi:hypothetical protein
MDPIALRKAKSVSAFNKPNSRPSSPSIVKTSSKWVPFSKRDSDALEKAYQVHKKNKQHEIITKKLE